MNYNAEEISQNAKKRDKKIENTKQMLKAERIEWDTMGDPAQWSKARTRNK